MQRIQKYIMMKANYENIALLLQNGTSVKIHADNFSVSNIRLLAQMAVKHDAVLHIVVNPNNILSDNLNLISQEGRKNITVEFV